MMIIIQTLILNIANFKELVIDKEKNVKEERLTEYKKIENMINNMIYPDRESVEIDKLFYNSIKDSKLLSNEEKIKLQALRFSKNMYFEFLDDYEKVDTYLQGLIDL